MANQIEVHLSNGKTVWFDGHVADIGKVNGAPSGLVLLKEWGSKHTFYLNPDHVVTLIDHGAPENAGQHTGKTRT